MTSSSLIPEENPGSETTTVTSIAQLPMLPGGGGERTIDWNDGLTVSVPPTEVAVGGTLVAVGPDGVSVEAGTSVSVFVGLGVFVGGRRGFAAVGGGGVGGRGVLVMVGVAVKGAAPSKSLAVAVGTGWLIASSKLSWAAAASSSVKPSACMAGSRMERAISATERPPSSARESALNLDINPGPQ